jgi:hypothetical protein
MTGFFLFSVNDVHFIRGTRGGVIVIVNVCSYLYSFTSECSSTTSLCAKNQINYKENQYPVIVSKIYILL